MRHLLVICDGCGEQIDYHLLSVKMTYEGRNRHFCTGLCTIEWIISEEKINRCSVCGELRYLQQFRDYPDVCSEACIDRKRGP